MSSAIQSILGPHSDKASGDPTKLMNNGPTTTPARKMTLQEWKKRTITVILIGETGTGKTAFMSLLSNVCAGRELEQFETTHDKSNEAGGKKSGSQTNKPVLYTIQCANGTEVRILDTPGLADTRGIDKDNEHKAAIAESIKKEIEAIDAVMILANGTQERLGDATEYALNVISGMFPNSIIDNIGFMFTMVANPFSFNFQRSSFPPELKNAKLWTVDNPLAQWDKYQEKLREEPDQDEDTLTEMKDSLQGCYQKTLKTLNNLFKWLDERSVQPVKAINDLYVMSTSIEASIANVIARIAQTEDMRRDLIKFQNQIGEQDQIQQINAKYKEIINKATYEHETTNEHNTLCVHGGCYNNCHISCGVGFTLDRKQLGRECSAFGATGKDGQNCLYCGHSALDHQHYKSRWAKREKTEEIIDEKAKARYDAAKSEAEQILITKEGVDAKIRNLEEATQRDEDELSRLCTEYNNLALSGSFVGYIESAIRLLQKRYETMKKTGSSADAQQKMEDRIKSLEMKKEVVEEAEKKKKGSSKKKGTWISSMF